MQLLEAHEKCVPCSAWTLTKLNSEPRLIIRSLIINHSRFFALSGAKSHYPTHKSAGGNTQLLANGHYSDERYSLA